MMTSNPYEEAAIKFVDDYDRENPVTRDEGFTYFINLLESKGLID